MICDSTWFLSYYEKLGIRLNYIVNVDRISEVRISLLAHIPNRDAITDFNMNYENMRIRKTDFILLYIYYVCC